MRLPSISSLRNEIQTVKVGRAIAYLLDRRPDLAEFEDLEDFVLSDAWEVSPRFQGMEQNLVTLRAGLARVLWSKGFYIGVTVLDSLLFSAVAKTEATDPVRSVLERIRDLGLHRPGLVLYPLHSVGVLGAGLLQWDRRATSFLQVPSFGLVLSPQTNSIDTTLLFIEQAADDLGIRRRMPMGLLEHWYRSRANWLERNPLLVARVSSYPGEYYENQYFLMARLQLATSLLLLTSALQDARDEDDSFFGSSARINNFQTLDIKHYIVLYPRVGSRRFLDGDCVPMNLSGPALAELCELPTEIDPRFWRRRRTVVDRLSSALNTVGSLYTSHAMLSTKNRLKARVARKLFKSLKHFRRSHRRTADPFDEIVNLAVAFEVLLSDHYTRGIVEQVCDRAKEAIGRRPGSRALIESIRNLYYARSQCVHDGTWPTEIDLQTARRAFVYSFLGVSENLTHIPRSSARPIAHILSSK